MDEANNVAAVLQVFGSVDKVTADKIQTIISNGKLKISTVTNAEDVARNLGDTKFNGDAYTVHLGIADRKTGQLKNSQHLTYIEKWQLQDNQLGQLMVTLHHEATHIKRFEEGRTLPDRKQEEIATYRESIAIMGGIASTLESQAKLWAKDYHDQKQIISYDPTTKAPVTVKNIIDELNHTASDIKNALKKDQQYLNSYLRN